MDLNMQFDLANISVSGELTQAEGLQVLNGMGITHNDASAGYSFVCPEGFYQIIFMSVWGDAPGLLTGGVSKNIYRKNTPMGEEHIYAESGETVFISSGNSPMLEAVKYVKVEIAVVWIDANYKTKALTGIYAYQSSSGGDGEGDEDEGNGNEGGESDNKTPQYIYPTGVVPFTSLPVLQIGFANHQSQTNYTHIQMRCAEILDDGTVGGEGHVWESGFCYKDIDFTTILSGLRSMCDGKDITHWNVTYTFLNLDEEGNYNVVGHYIVGGATNVVTFSVTDEVKKSPINLEDTAYCLDPVLLTINRSETPEIQNVTVEVQGYKADFEFYADRNILEIDIAEYLQVLFANVDIFEHQQLTSTVLVKLYDANGEILEKQGITITAIYGKKPDPALPRCGVRLQWVDKYAVLHEEYFKIAANQTEGASAQKYVVNREEREDKTGEKSITLAKVLANNAEREALKTIVFSDHVRAWIGDGWKRVRIANTYKTGAGREKKNFEITIKYAL